MNWPKSGGSYATPLETTRVCSQCQGLVLAGADICVSCSLISVLSGDTDPETGNLDALLAQLDAQENPPDVGNYYLLDEIGRGGMGVIYRARQRHSERIVALKRVSNLHLESTEAVVRFRREAEAIARLDHPHILPIYEVGEAAGTPFLVMKYAPGGSLQRPNVPLPTSVAQRVAMLRAITDAVRYSHAAGFVHRDIKPANILLTSDGKPMLSDFGLAARMSQASDLTQPLTLLGTPGYVAPEQLSPTASHSAPTADIYGIGAVLFYVLAGRPPFVGADSLAVARQATESAAPRLRMFVPSIDKDLQTLCARCLEREPSARYQTATELADELDRWLDGRPIRARPVAPAAMAWRWAKRKPALAALGIASTVAALASVSLFAERQFEREAAHSVVVEPFVNLDEPTTDFAFTTAFTQVLQRSMKDLGPARVDAANGAPQRTDPQNSRARLSGTTRRTPTGVRVNVLLAPARKGATPRHWTLETSESQATTAVARMIAADAYAAVDEQKQREVGEDPGMANPKCREFIESGIHLVERRSTVDLDRARRCLGRALEIEPQSGTAYTYLAFAESMRIESTSNLDTITFAETTARRALELVPNTARAHRAVGWALYEKGDIAGAWDEAIRGLETEGVQARAGNLPGTIERYRGRPDRALRWFKLGDDQLPHPAENEFALGDCWADLADDAKADAIYERFSNLNPEQPDGWIGRCRLLLLNKRFNDARELCAANANRYGDFAPSEQMAAQVAFFSRDFADAEARYGRLMAREGSGGGGFFGAISFPTALAAIHLSRGDVEAASALLEAAHSRLERRLAVFPGHRNALYELAAVEAMQSNKDMAFQKLRAAIDAGWVDYRSTAIDPRFDALRGDPRFQTLVDEIASHVAHLRQQLLASASE